MIRFVILFKIYDYEKIIIRKVTILQFQEPIACHLPLALESGVMDYGYPEYYPLVRVAAFSINIHLSDIVVP